MTQFSNKGLYEIAKRSFDVLVAGMLLLLLSPVFALIALALKWEDSTAPVFYAAPRVGRNYRLFSFFKFRSMRPNADQLLAAVKHLNQYADPAAPEKQGSTSLEMHPIASVNPANTQFLLSDEGWQDETEVLAAHGQVTEKPFLKIANDPRITRVGHFIRNTSLDELPQLWNVVKGDMSLVGNRPLPPYEAEQLTTDGAVARFMAPAGITGLWQVTDRGKKGMSADRRKKFDADYSSRYSFLLDCWILIKTPMAALQKVDA